MILTFEPSDLDLEPLNVRQTIKHCRSSYYMVHTVSKEYDLGRLEGRCRMYSPEEVEFIKQAIHYRKYGRKVIAMFNYIKKYPGVEEGRLRKHLGASTYTYNLVLATLTFSCYLWEDIRLNQYGNEKTVYFIDGTFFDKHLKLLKGKMNV